MSSTWYIACPETKQRVWIGQGTYTTMSTFYSDESEIMDCLAGFLSLHAGKSLVVVNIEDPIFDQGDYTDFCDPL